MKKFQMLATDMDGTLLNHKHAISPENQDAIHRAFKEGKTVVFCSGRCAAELREYIELFPEMRFAVTESGACVYDFQEEKGYDRHSFEAGIAKKIIEYAYDKDILIQLVMEDRGHIPATCLAKLGYYHLSQYQAFFETVAHHVEDIQDQCRQGNWLLDKICLYHPSAEDRDRTAMALEGLPVTLALAEETGIEISPFGVNKAIGLEALCRRLCLSMEEVIMVGDSFNDLGALAAAGLPLLVANARPEVKRLGYRQVADCEHGAIAEAIRTYLL